MPFGNMSGPTLIVIVFVILLLFGAPKLPALAKSLGQSMKILKKEVTNDGGKKGDESVADASADVDADRATAASEAAAPAVPAAPSAPAASAPASSDDELARAKAEAAQAKAEAEALRAAAQKRAEAQTAEGDKN